MHEKKRMLLLITILSISCLIVVSITTVILYNSYFEEQRKRLVETVEVQASLVESITQLDREHTKQYHKGSKPDAINHIMEAHKAYEKTNPTMEITMAKYEAGTIKFILHQRF